MSMWGKTNDRPENVPQPASQPQQPMVQRPSAPAPAPAPVSHAAQATMGRSTRLRGDVYSEEELFLDGEMEVDYRAVASSLVLAGPDAEHLWAATDTGMILRLMK